MSVVQLDPGRGRAFCESAVHRHRCCPAAFDWVPRRRDQWLDDDDETVVRQPSGQEMASFLLMKLDEFQTDGRVSPVTALAFAKIIAAYVPLVDTEYWDDTLVGTGKGRFGLVEEDEIDDAEW